MHVCVQCRNFRTEQYMCRVQDHLSAELLSRYRHKLVQGMMGVIPSDWWPESLKNIL